MVFVFGSNEKGAHGAGAAKIALNKHGAKWGKGVGHFGNSYAIPTKDSLLRTLELGLIAQYVDEFLDYADAHPELEFQVTQIGCGLAGYNPEDIAPMFVTAPSNCYFDEAWKEHLAPEAKFWGTFV